MGDGVMWNLGYRAGGDPEDDERPMQQVNKDGTAEGWIESAEKPKPVDRFNPSLSSSSVSGMGGSKTVMPATKPKAAPQGALTPQELSAWADSEIARLKAGDDAPTAVQDKGQGVPQWTPQAQDEPPGWLTKFMRTSK